MFITGSCLASTGKSDTKHWQPFKLDNNSSSSLLTTTTENLTYCLFRTLNFKSYLAHCQFWFLLVRPGKRRENLGKFQGEITAHISSLKLFRGPPNNKEIFWFPNLIVIYPLILHYVGENSSCPHFWEVLHFPI